MASELLDVASRAPNAEETSRAKNQLKSSVFMNLESAAVLTEDLGRQSIVFGKVLFAFRCNRGEGLS